MTGSTDHARLVKHLQRVEDDRNRLLRSRRLSPTAEAMVRLRANLEAFAELSADARSEWTSGRFEKAAGSRQMAKSLTAVETLARQAAERVDDWLAQPDVNPMDLALGRHAGSA